MQLRMEVSTRLEKFLWLNRFRFVCVIQCSGGGDFCIRLIYIINVVSQLGMSKSVYSVCEH